jgi:predicted unusual protein kinase regulating ubiquinone biosynthesis (AarF/ABC1/UbiB family)
MAEGMCRGLSPEENMWVLAQPQIEAWARENLGPEARLRDAAVETIGALRRVPRMLERAEQALESLESRAKINTGTGRRIRLSGVHAALGIIAGLLVALLVLQFI